MTYGTVATKTAVELVKEKMETLKQQKAKASQEQYVPPKRENVLPRYLQISNKKKMDIDNSVGRPINFAFD